MVWTSRRVETERPGHSALSGLSKLAFSRMVPLAVSTWLSISFSVPSPSCFFPSELKAVTFSGPDFSASLIAGRCCSGAVKITEIGCSCVIVRMPF